MAGKRTLKEKIVSALDIPKDVGLDYARFVMVGFDEILIENLKGIREYEESKVKINTKSGLLVIRGVGLQILEINNKDIFVRGKIQHIELQHGKDY